MLWKCCTQYASKFRKLSSGHRTGKAQFSFQSQRKTMPKNARTIIMHNCTHLTHWQSNAQNSQSQASTVREPRTPRCSSWIKERQRNQRSNCPVHWIIGKAREFQKNIYFYFIDYTKVSECVDHNKPWNIKRWEYHTTSPASWEICMRVKKQQLELDLWQQGKG